MARSDLSTNSGTGQAAAIGTVAGTIQMLGKDNHKWIANLNKFVNEPPESMARAGFHPSFDDIGDPDHGSLGGVVMHG